jgi:phytoene dehydrogenase-like protein
MTFSSVDPTLAPAGKHTLFIWGQYYPYELTNGERWENIQEREADKLIDVVNSYAPNVKNSIIDRFVQSPLDLEQRLGLLRGNVMHVEMDFDRCFCFDLCRKCQLIKRRLKIFISRALQRIPAAAFLPLPVTTRRRLF